MIGAKIQDAVILINDKSRSCLTVIETGFSADSSGQIGKP